MTAKIYLETTLVSYLTSRPSRDVIRASRQASTQELWDRLGEFEAYVSDLLVGEAGMGYQGYETRDKAVFAAMRQWTSEWWDDERHVYRCFTSDAVINEVESGEHPEKEQKLAFLGSVDLLDIQTEIEEIVEVYLAKFLLPKDELGDALHLAIEDVRKSRKEISCKCEYDPKKLVSFYMERQKSRQKTKPSSEHADVRRTG